MKTLKLFAYLTLILIILTQSGCAQRPTLTLKAELLEYSPYMSSTPGIPLSAVSALDLKNWTVKSSQP